MQPYLVYVSPYMMQPYYPHWRLHEAAPLPVQPYCIRKAETELKSSMRLLWEQHVTWTRMTILSLVFNLPDVVPVTARLLRNATDMGNSLRMFYGNQAAETYSSLIRTHLVIAADLVKAALAGNQKLVDQKEKEWYANADDIVNFLSGINPFLPKESFRNMFYEHLALTKAEAVAMISKDYESGVQIFDQIELQALAMADMISDAIVKQFPDRFM